MASAIRTGARPLLALGVLALLPYANALRAGFTFDDEFQIRTNPAVVGGLDLIGILSSPLPPGNLFRPLTVLSFALNEWLTPGSAGAFHAVNIVLHAAVTLLVYLLARRVLGSSRAAFIGAALFAVHPLHTEAVTSLAGRAEVLAALCGLGALLTLARADAAKTRAANTALHVASLLLFALAVLSKESALTLLPLLVLFRITLRGQPLSVGVRKEIRALDWVPYALCAILFIMWHAFVTREAPRDLTPLDNALAFVPWPMRVRSAFGVLWDYFGLLNLPAVLSADYSYNQTPGVTVWWSPRCWAGLALVTLAAAYGIRGRWSGVGFAIALLLITLSLTANLLFPIGTIKAERLLYLPSVGWALLAGWGFDRLLCARRYRAVGLAALGLVIVAFAVRTWVRNWDWQDNDTLYESMARTAPNSAKARFNFGVLLQQRGNYDAAAVQFHRALEIYPWAEGAALGIAIGFEKQGHTPVAVDWYRKAVKITPSFYRGHLGLCSILVNTGSYAEADRACRAGLRSKPADADLLKGLGLSLVGTGAADAGVAVLHRAARLNPNDREIQSYLHQLGDEQAGRMVGRQ